MGDGADFAWLGEIAADAPTRRRLARIERDRRAVRERGKIIRRRRVFPLKLGGYTVWFAENSVCSSIDIYTEIFQDDCHMRAPGFQAREASVVLDIGANEGHYTLRVKQNNPDCKILAVEPNPAAFALLRRNVEENGLRGVALEQKAVTSRPGPIPFEVVEEVTAIGALRLDRSLRPWLAPERIRTITVEGATLPALCAAHGLERIDLLKLDVEGAELAVLEGATELLPRLDKLVVEYHSPPLRCAVTEFLLAQGFTLVGEEPGQCGELYFARGAPASPT